MSNIWKKSGIAEMTTGLATVWKSTDYSQNEPFLNKTKLKFNMSHLGLMLKINSEKDSCLIEI